MQRETFIEADLDNYIQSSPMINYHTLGFQERSSQNLIISCQAFNSEVIFD